MEVQDNEEDITENSTTSYGSDRLRPNILITGTPGVGKTSFAHELMDHLSTNFFELLSIPNVIKENNFVLADEFDLERNCDVLDEDALLDYLEPIIGQGEGGKIVEYHGCELFPERWFDVVIVLRTETSKLYERLEKRGYTESKISENVQCEIFQTLLEEARDSYRSEIIHELQNNDLTDMERNIQFVEDLIAR